MRVVLAQHSHHRLPAHFRCTDDGDEQRLGLYAVVGVLDTVHPEAALRGEPTTRGCRCPGERSSTAIKEPSGSPDSTHPMARAGTPATAMVRSGRPDDLRDRHATARLRRGAAPLSCGVDWCTARDVTTASAWCRAWAGRRLVGRASWPRGYPARSAERCSSVDARGRPHPCPAGASLPGPKRQRCLGEAGRSCVPATSVPQTNECRQTTM